MRTQNITVCFAEILGHTDVRENPADDELNSKRVYEKLGIARLD